MSQVTYAGQYEVEITESGVRCDNHGRARTYHANVDSVRACFAASREMEADMAAEQAAELSYVRHLEDRGYDDARAQDEYEARMGVVSFQDAWCQADPINCPQAQRDREAALEEAASVIGKRR